MVLLAASLLVVLGFALAGVVWGWIWFSAVHGIPYFYLVRMGVDAVCYWAVGRSAVTRAARLHRLQPVQLGLALLYSAGFYVGNRLIGFSVLLNQQYYDSTSLSLLLSEIVVLVAALLGVFALALRAES